MPAITHVIIEIYWSGFRKLNEAPRLRSAYVAKRTKHHWIRLLAVPPLSNDTMSTSYAVRIVATQHPPPRCGVLTIAMSQCVVQTIAPTADVSSTDVTARFTAHMNEAHLVTWNLCSTLPVRESLSVTANRRASKDCAALTHFDIAACSSVSHTAHTRSQVHKITSL